ncbi:protein required for attachment to host cells [Paucimonas lemoignei]|uniref:Protein required for attachment to host cells n=1 Tax=Paucimonas lemoignei TaxID=29443 RepID=A0A4R3HSA8_PAULE|nr:host attachment protein [Paucimonas lemoignei]TCS36036.1 protein required for attachment to host cells [Paucimonas lemoignei]
MNATWIVSANASRARFFSQMQTEDHLEEVNDMINDAVRQRMLEASETDKLGPTSATKSMHNTGGATPNKLYEPAQTPDQHQAELFARDIINYLLQSHREGRFQQLSLVVSPKFLGMLRSLMPAELESVVSMELNKDYTQFSGDQLLEQIKGQVAKKSS